MVSTIGIKLANGEFYSILEENSTVKRRLILTTVHDAQQSMQIDLYKSFARSMADALYIGSIVVENIQEKPKGEPSIELILTSNADDELTADAVDLDASSNNAEHLHLSVSLLALEGNTSEPEQSDFALDFHELPPSGLYEKAASDQDNEGRNEFLPLISIIAGVLILMLGFCLWFFVFRDYGKKTVDEMVITTPQNQAQSAPEPSVPEETDAALSSAPEPSAPEETDAAQRTSVPVIEAPAAPPPARTASQDQETAARRRRRNPPVASYKVPTTIPQEGYPYRVRWGDTLWDISEAFYRNPWLYPRIARFNAIRNPDLIVAGKTIHIPAKN
jgi:hypothetical protein